MADIEITITDDGDKGAYRTPVEGSEVGAELTWHRRGDARVADHTFTPPAARGKGIAFKLVQAMIDDARANGFKIKPLCPYVVAQFDKHPEWADLRA
ncbi:GNAT family N-acetyltransferase [Aurantiacibacter sp. MUD11]|uniref:GNAT family N-acetyltransferase n=1 Tax=Aurantiacibacter sp. MUD11 TaxID=3003265 RepID=UPI0022A9F9D1|nr:GNAT family N-acetyltransferase [Aurantiacibacter sp. MUD11]WAT17275.1 GNAT family N-acetyltransferase [Aurantiacibacter sp. MUD11]